MDNVYILFWIVFSIILATLYYGLIASENSVGPKISQSLSKVSGTLKTVFLRFIKTAPGFILKNIFQYGTPHPQNENKARTDFKADGITGWREWLEWLVVIISIWGYCLPFLDLGSSYNLPGSETESFQAFDQILEFSLKKYGEFPLWNPYFFTGIPYVAHPMLHAYNPFISIPVMLFGVLDGFKIAVFLGFIIAGLGMWWLGKEMGLSRASRVWVALMYAFCGVPAAKFIQGQYLMVLAFGWIPFSLAAIVAATRTRQRKHIYAAAGGLALLFFSGNVYYAYYMLYVVALYTIVVLLKLERKPVRLKVDWEGIKVLIAVGVLSLGLIAIQLLPLLQYRNQFSKSINPQLTDSRDVKDVFLDLVFPEPFRPGAFSDALRPEEFYAYIGWWPLTGILFLPFFTLDVKKKRYLPFFLAVIIFTFAWIDVKDMPWRVFFQEIPFLYQFRYPSRMIVMGAMSLVLAGGLGLDAAWDGAKKFMAGKPVDNRRRWVGTLFIFAMCVFMLGSVYNLASTSQPLLHTTSKREPYQQVIDWLRNFDSGIYYVVTQGNWHRPTIGNEIRYLNIWDSISVIPDFDDQISDRTIEAQPRYQILLSDTAAPRNTTLIKTFDTINIYKATDDLPFAFIMSTSTLTADSKSDLSAGEVTPVSSVTARINNVEVLVDSDTTGALVLLSTFSPGWELSVDGNPGKIYNAYGYMAAEVIKGSHRYLFTYRPVSFFIGLVISLATLLTMVAVLVLDTWQNTSARRKKPQAIQPE
jgi:hypothetical protein